MFPNLTNIQVYSEIKTGNTIIKLDLSGLKKIVDDLDNDVDKIVRETAFDAEGQMKSRAAVKYGAMKNSIHVKTSSYNGGPDAIASAQSANPDVGIADFPAPGKKGIAHVGPAVEYAFYQEFGTYKMAAHPFVVPGLFAAEGNLRRRVPELFK